MRVRFAPSPTGALHIGGARTALYNWLMARGAGGTFVLRVEDTDRERSTPENVQQILDALRWLELDWDVGPDFQSSHADRHAEVLHGLLDRGLAYRTSATAEDVRAYKERHGADRGFRGEGWAGSGHGAIRLRVPDEGETVVHDLIRGDTTFQHVHLDDPVIARADGSVLYNFAVAVDDVDGRFTHVVRGEDHLSNTPKQLLVMEAMGGAPPLFAHLPLLHGPDGKKLSKRHGAASVQELRDRGYVPEAVRNYLALLGWGYDEETTFFTTEELQRNFSLERVSRSPAVFDEQKLRWMNGRYLRELPLRELTRRLEELTGRTGLEPVATIAQEKMSTLDEFWPLARSFFDGPVDDPRAREKVLSKDGAIVNLAAAREALEGLVEPWTPEQVEAALTPVVERLGVKAGQVYQPLRVALTGTTISPGIFETVAVLGRDEALARLDRVLAGASAT